MEWNGIEGWNRDLARNEMDGWNGWSKLEEVTEWS